MDAIPYGNSEVDGMTSIDRIRNPFIAQLRKMDRDNIKAAARKAGHIIDSKAYRHLTSKEQATLEDLTIMADKYGPLFMDELAPEHQIIGDEPA